MDKVHQIMKENPEIVQKAMEEHLEKMQPDYYSKEAIIDRHNAFANQMMDRNLSHIPFSFPSVLKKPHASDNSRYGILTQIPISSLVVNTTHTGRKLVGTLVVDATVLSNAHSVIEDDYGRAIKIQLPNPFSDK